MEKAVNFFLNMQTLKKIQQGTKYVWHRLMLAFHIFAYYSF